MDRVSLNRYAWMSIAAAVLTMGLKGAAYMVTGSVALLSDALECLVNLAAGIVALTMLNVAALPADDNHAYGHTKAEYFGSGLQGAFILVAAVSIAASALRRMIHPVALEAVSLGLGISLAASMVNLGTATLLLRAARKHDSIILEADAYHLFTDVLTTVGVLVGVAVTALTGWRRLDPLVALLVAANILRTGHGIVRRSVSGLMDTALAPEEREKVKAVIRSYQGESTQFHALRTRQAGRRRFVSMHVLVPGQWTVHQGHELLERIEADVRRVLPNTVVFTHLESLDDPRSWEDATLERKEHKP